MSRHEFAHLRSDPPDPGAKPSKHGMFSVALLSTHTYIHFNSSVESSEEGCMCTPLRVRMLWLLIAFALLPGRLLAQQTGILSGVVHDAQGAVLPGVTVTVTSGSLIGGERTVTTGATGTYQFTSLPPGAYAVTYELAGFSALKRDDIRVLVAQTTRLDVDLSVGNLQETVTVTGDSPVVDVSSTTTQTNISKEIYDTIPTGRNPWVMAALVPGVVTGRLDVGGTHGWGSRLERKPVRRGTRSMSRTTGAPRLADRSRKTSCGSLALRGGGGSINSRLAR
jgi:hypothetical protein